MTNHRSPSTSHSNQSPSNFSSLPPLPPPPPSLAPPPPPPPSSPPPPPPPPEDEDDERAFKKEEERVHTEYRTMASLGLPVQFSSTKGKQVEGADVSGARIIKKRRYRQYMNRKGGFNRPLDGGIM